MGVRLRNGSPFELLDITTENWVRFAKNSEMQLMVDCVEIQTLDVASLFDPKSSVCLSFISLRMVRSRRAAARFS
jgi:hypothetical protein